MAMMPRRPRGEPFMLTLGKWVAAQAALNRLDFDDVADVYRQGGGRWPSSNKVQVAKLRVFWRWGVQEGADGLLELEGWSRPRKPGFSTTETVIRELRQRLK